MKQKLQLLVIDDDPLIHQSIQVSLPSQWNLTCQKNFEDNSAIKFDAALIDIHLTGDLENPNGLDVIQKMSDKFPHLEIIAFSGHLDRKIMEQSLKAGASRFLIKPICNEELHLLLSKIESFILLREASNRSWINFTPWIGSGSTSIKIKKSISELYGETGPILIEGESGTGKEVVARLIHEQENQNMPFICINAAAIPESLAESELFGHTKGAFTGAHTNKMGLAEAANGGILFIDEIEALPLSLQAKLLRFMEYGELRRVGSKENKYIKTKIIAATNRNLEDMVFNKEFREDLLWRLKGKKILLPPLRDRNEEIIELAEYFLKRQRPQHKKTFSDDAKHSLKKYHWPGNVRELKKVCEQVCLSSPLPIIRTEDIERLLTSYNKASERKTIDSSELGLTKLVQNYESQILKSYLEEYSDINVILDKLNISRSNLYKKMKDYGLSKK